MNAASHQKFMSYEATRLLPLLHLKLILCPPVWGKQQRRDAAMENFGARLKVPLLVDGKNHP